MVFLECYVQIQQSTVYLQKIEIDIYNRSPVNVVDRFMESTRSSETTLNKTTRYHEYKMHFHCLIVTINMLLSNVISLVIVSQY